MLVGCRRPPLGLSEPSGDPGRGAGLAVLPFLRARAAEREHHRFPGGAGVPPGGHHVAAGAPAGAGPAAAGRPAGGRRGGDRRQRTPLPVAQPPGGPAAAGGLLRSGHRSATTAPAPHQADAGVGGAAAARQEATRRDQGPAPAGAAPPGRSQGTDPLRPDPARLAPSGSGPWPACQSPSSSRMLRPWRCRRPGPLRRGRSDPGSGGWCRPGPPPDRPRTSGPRSPG
jgi:hypothetical protein